MTNDDESLPTFPTKWNGPPLLKPATVPFHPAAAITPMMDKDEAEALVASIREYGLDHPILIRDGKIIDGRNRYYGCLAAGVEPIFEQDGDANPLSDCDLVLIRNVHRRHLSVGYRARLGISLVTTTHGGDRKSTPENQIPHAEDFGRTKVTQAAAAQIVGVHAQRLSEVVFVRNNLVERLRAKFETDEMTLTSALFLAKKNRDEQREDPRVKFAGRSGGRTPRPDIQITDRAISRYSADQAAVIVKKLVIAKFGDSEWDFLFEDPTVWARVERALARRARA